MTRISPEAQRRRRLITRAAPFLGAGAVLAFVLGIVAGAGPDNPGAARFLEAWEQRDYEAMYAELAPQSQREFGLDEFERAYVDAAETATVTEVATTEPSEAGDSASSEVSLGTRVFGDLAGTIELPLVDGLVSWSPELVYPGLSEGEYLTRRTRAPPRAAILASDRSPLASGPAAARTRETSAAAVVGETGSPSKEQSAALTAAGFPPGSLTGTSGLELAFNERLSGKPGGQLLASGPGEEAGLEAGRELARTNPVKGKPVRTSIDPNLQSTAVSALGDLYGGVAVLNARDGSVLALAGLGYSAPQPPGSTFKVITATAALEEGIVKPADEFPVEVSNSEIGREIANSHDSPCGGDFVTTFADSCNTVFAPLGVEVGSAKLVETAEAFGFNAPPPLFNDDATAAIEPPLSSLPTELDSSVAIGETAIGQGQVLATPLQMAAVAQTIANKGVRLPNAIAKAEELQPDLEPVEVTSAKTASAVAEMMVEVVKRGTGVAAALPGVPVAGKTGTAELGPAALEPGQELGPDEEVPLETDAWFTAFAPAADPKLAIAVMIVDSTGDGGTVAAPIAREVLAGGLGLR